MATRIENWPAGLLSLLRSQNFGTGPRDLSDVVSPVIDVGDLYIQNSIQHGFALFSPALGFVDQDAAAGAAITLTVPTGELWWIEMASLRLNPAAGITLAGQIVVKDTPAQYFAVSSIVATAALEHALTMLHRPFWMTPGQRISANYSAVTGAPGAGSALMTVRYASFKL